MRIACLLSLCFLLFLPAPTAWPQSPKDDPPLLQAADQGDLAKVRQLLDAGTDVSTHSANGLNALNWAAYSGHLDIAKLLLERGIDVESNQNGAGWSALMNASNQGFLDIVQLLLDKGARVDQLSKDKWTPLDYAATNKHVEVAKLLLAHGADGTASLLEMVGRKNPDGIRTLLAAGVSADARGADGETALYRAAHDQQLDLVRLLLVSGANPNLYPVQSSNMDTPLKWAAYYCNIDLARALLVGGADKDGRGDSAYSLAETGWTDDMKPCSAELQALLQK